MKSNLRNFVYQDLIGKELEAKHKTNKSWIDFKKIGKVVDETKNTLKIEQQKGEKIKTYVKEQYIFRCWVPTNQKLDEKVLVEFDGKKVMGTPAERIKKIKKPRRKLH